MKNFRNNIILTFILSFGIFITSCNDYLDINKDPNQSSTSDKDLQLSGAQLYMAVGFGERIFPILGTWCQYHTGGPGVSLGEADQHQLSSSEGNQIFRNVYRAAVNLNFVIKTSPNEKNYVAISKLLKAYGIQTCVDLFGNVPYTQALKGDLEDGSILHPAYDNAKDVIYPALINEVKDALKLIGEGVGFDKPGSNDLVYGGDMNKWTMFGNTLLFKLYMRSGNDAGARDLISSAASFITSNADAAMVRFPGGSTGSNPFFTAARSTALGNFYVATTTAIGYLEKTGDPRINYLYDQADGGGHKGLKPGDVENAPTSSATFSKPAGALKPEGGLLFNSTMPVLFMTAWEGNLLLAEAAAKGLGGDTKSSYNAAVSAHFAYLGVTAGKDAEYLAAGGALDSVNPIKSISYQKWVCMNGLQPIESWIETRRLDNNANQVFTSANGIFEVPTKNSLGGRTFPSILPYPEIEESLNQSFPGQHELTSKLFWDNQ